MDSSAQQSSALTQQRPTDFRVCNDDGNGIRDPSGNTADAFGRPWGVASIDFTYSIETPFSPESLADGEKDAILTSLSAAIVESVYEYGCVPKRERKRRRQSAVSFSSSGTISRRAEILSISPGVGHEWLGDCDYISFGNDLFCSEIRGTIVVAFDGKEYPKSNAIVASDFKSVGKSVLSRIEEDMTNGNYIAMVNNDLQNFGMVIDSMKYIDSDYPDRASENAFTPLDWSKTDEIEPYSGLTRFSKIAIPIMVILSLIAMVLCWCAIISWPKDSFFAKLMRSREERRREKDLKRKRMKESKPSLSLEATLQDLSESEVKKYGDTNPLHSSNSMGNNKSPHRLNRFSMQISDGTFHPSDTETGSSVEDYPPSQGRLDGSKANVRGNAMPTRALSSFFSRFNSTEVTPEPTIMERIGACSPTDNCFVNGPKGNTNSNNNGTVMRYIVPGVERSNSLIDESEGPPITRDSTMPTENTARSPTHAMGTKKTSAYREYINKKMFQRNAQYEQSDGEVVPMEIGVKRTFTDAQGKIREMVAL